ncbi:MAG: hypothetical protein EOM50_12765 [Erysipelotrichia bacterium]|nr:hypothetical protein [Erysipelotrichia bacterium]
MQEKLKITPVSQIIFNGPTQENINQCFCFKKIEKDWGFLGVTPTPFIENGTEYCVGWLINISNENRNK